MRYFTLRSLLFFFLFTGSILSAQQAEEKTCTNSYPIGELGAKWQFPSDHLPVGGTVGNIHFVVWNVLNTHYLQWIENNAQGLLNSLIMTANQPFSKSLTIREEMVVKNVLQMIRHPSCPRALLALQELGEPVYNALSKRLPKSHQLFPKKLPDNKMEDIFIVDTRLFEILDYSYAQYSFRNNTMVKLVLLEKKTGLTYCFIQSHIPGGPVDSIPARAEFAEYVMFNYDPEAITILLGDMNRSPDYFLPNFSVAAKNHGLSFQPFKIMKVPYPTHVDTHMEASWIDNIFIANPYNISEKASEGVQLLDDLNATIELLEESVQIVLNTIN